jgi:hypothetical protein
MQFCVRCANTKWICDMHRGRPWNGPHACGCGAPGEPCPTCNRPGPDGLPELPEGFVVDVQKQ